MAYILVVEDDFDIRDTMAQILEGEGYAVVGAAHGKEALEVLRAGATPSLILLDLMMPVMNGWEFREAQRADPALAPIPVVVISADAGIHEKATVIAADAYLKKPIQLDALLAVVARYA